jgi:hypothetical protein
MSSFSGRKTKEAVPYKLTRVACDYVTGKKQEKIM